MSSSDRSNDDLARELDQLREELAALKDAAAEQAASLLERGKKTARALKDTIAQKAQDGWECTRDCIEERPLTSVLVAFGAGLVLGAYLLRRR